MSGTAGSSWQITEVQLAAPRGGHEGAGAVGQAHGAATKKYTLDEINDGYQDLMDGKNIRGVVVHQH